jgi:tagaturonate reductase
MRELARLSGACWPATAYPRTALPERVLQFGTGMLLRAVCAASVDAANRAGSFGGRIVVVQSTPRGQAGAINAQDGLFTLVERGLENGAPIERSRLIGAISRALVAEVDWEGVCDVASRPELQVIVSNVTEAGFRADGAFPARLTDLLHTRFTRLPDGPPVFVIPTELVDENGPRLAAMVERLAAGREGAGFRDWLARRVRFCSSLVDRITTGTPAPEALATLEDRLGYRDALLTVTEPHSLWAIEADPVILRAAFAIDRTPHVIFSPDIALYRERKVRLLNGAHTALAPLALLAGIRTVREAAEHPRLGALLRHIIFEELAPATNLPADVTSAFGHAVLDRFRNPWLDHEWRVIATNQTAKLRLRVVPAVVGYARKRGAPPPGLALAFAAYLRSARFRPLWETDADWPLIERHWRAVDPGPPGGSVPAGTWERLAARALADEDLWGVGADLTSLPGFLEATTQRLLALERDGVDRALEALEGILDPATSGRA